MVAWCPCIDPNIGFIPCPDDDWYNIFHKKKLLIVSVFGHSPQVFYFYARVKKRMIKHECSLEFRGKQMHKYDNFSTNHHISVFYKSLTHMH